MSSAAQQDVRVVGRYALHGAIASGGMATVHLGRLLGAVGFTRTVAIKRLHAQFANDPDFVSMFLDEARLAARIRHPNVVPTLDVVATGEEVFLVMEYVPGESVSRLARGLREREQTIPLRILSAILAGVLHGLHAAHEAKNERGHALGIVHRDVSPQNVLVGVDGVARVLDFGVAKAAGRVQTTKEGQIKGKIAYMPPEQLHGAEVSRQTDIYAVGVMFWELVTGQRLFTGDNEGAVVAKVLAGNIPPPSAALTPARMLVTADDARKLEALDATILRAVAMAPETRFTTAREMALEIERVSPPATASEVADWLESVARDVLQSRAALVAEIERTASIEGDGEWEGETLPLSDGSGSVRQAPNAPPSSPTLATSAQSPRAKASTFPPATLALNPVYAPAIDGPPFTQPSSISVAAGSSAAPPAPPRDGRRAVLAVVLGVLVGVAVLAGLFLVQRFRDRGPAAGPSIEPARTAGATAAPEPPPAIERAAEAATLDITPWELADAGAEDPPPAKPPATRRTRPRTKTAPARTNECATPYWYDEKGVKRYKAQCLGK